MHVTVWSCSRSSENEDPSVLSENVFTVHHSDKNTRDYVKRRMIWAHGFLNLIVRPLGLLAFRPVPEATHHGRSMRWGKAAHLLAPRKQRRTSRFVV